MAKKPTAVAAAAEELPAYKGLPVVSLAKINRTIPPGLVFKPNSDKEAQSLEALGATRPATESELALYAQIENARASAVPAPAPAADTNNPLE